MLVHARRKAQRGYVVHVRYNPNYSLSSFVCVWPRECTCYYTYFHATNDAVSPFTSMHAKYDILQPLFPRGERLTSKQSRFCRQAPYDDVHVSMYSLMTAMLHKCCPRGERLTSMYLLLSARARSCLSLQAPAIKAVTAIAERRRIASQSHTAKFLSAA